MDRRLRSCGEANPVGKAIRAGAVEVRGVREVPVLDEVLLGEE